MNFFPNLSIQRKQTIIMMVTTSIALLLVCATLTVFETITFRLQMTDNLSTYANITGNNVSAALDFNDMQAAEDTLTALKAEPDIIGACVYTPDGKLFAQYSRKGARFVPPKKIEQNGFTFNKDSLALFQPIQSQGQVTGIIYLESDTRELRSRLTQYLGISFIVLLVTLLISLVLSSRLQRLVSKPILDLARAAREVAEHNNYSVRVQRHSADEIGVLVDAFNKMLAQIQGRDAELERRVVERTQELAKSLSILNATLDSTTDGILVVSPERKAILQNRKFAELWKIPSGIAEDPDDKKRLEWVTNMVKDTEQFVVRVSHLYAHPEEKSRDEIVLKDGVVMERISGPVLGDDGKNYGRIWMFRDITERKRAEEELRESQARYHSLVEQMPAGIFRKDAAGRYVVANSWFCTLYGIKPDDILGKTTDEVAASEAVKNGVHPLIMGSTHHETIMRTGKTIEATEDHVDVQGRTWHVQVIKTPVFSADGKTVGSQGILMDITERKRAEEELRESQALYHSLVEQMPAGIFRKNADGRYVLVNNWFCRVCGIKPEDIIGKTADEVAASEAKGSEIHSLNQGASHHDIIMRTGKVIEATEDHFDADGHLWHVQAIKTPVFNAEGKTIGTQGILMDVTEQKRAETALAYEQYLLKALLDNSDDKIYFKDLESKFIRCSSSMAKIFNVEKPEVLIGKSDRDFFSAEHAAAAFEDEQTITRTGQPVIGKVEKETWPDGRVTWVLSTKMPLRDKDGKIAGTFGVSKDITALKEAETKLEQAHQRLMETSRQAGMAEVATSVLHNVGNVLNSANVSSSLIAEKVRASRVANIGKLAGLLHEHERDLGNFLTNDPKGKQLPAYIAGLAEHLAQEQEVILSEVNSLVSNIVHIKEIVAMQQSYAKASGLFETLLPADLVEDALRMNLGAINRHNIKIIRDFGKVPAVNTDKHKVLQILVNLIRNAKYACDDSGREDKQITVRVANGGESVKISVIDNGIGIAPENLTRIFNHGFTTRKEGHGFGLHSGANAARELKGKLTVSSEGIGRGAAFILELPAATEVCA